MMKRSLLLALSFLLLLSPGLHAQDQVRIGDETFVPPQNVRKLPKGKRGVSSLELGSAVQGQHAVLVQFSQIPNVAQRKALAKRGVKLDGYINGKAYFALVPAGVYPSDYVGTGLTSVMPIRDSWRLSSQLQDGKIPEWAQRGKGRVAVTLFYFPSVDRAWVARYFSARGVACDVDHPMEGYVRVELSQSLLAELTKESWVKLINPIDPPQELYNSTGRVLSGADLLSRDASHGGYNLTGKGVRVGVWDGNVLDHVDYGSRRHPMESETDVKSTGGHGMHVSGTIAGAGLLDPRAKGMAPGVEFWTSNFNTSSNGLAEWEEMLILHKKERITISSNSYGMRMAMLCPFVDRISYSFFSGNPLTDKLAYENPELTLVYSSGNEQGACDRVFGSNLNFKKNVIYVGAVNDLGYITKFSSLGPMDDGRLLTHVVAKGQAVYSTMPGQSYGSMNGTSMSCPTVSGHLALITERWHQLHGGHEIHSALLKAIACNTADDAGNPGPDYKYGFGILNAVAAVEAVDQGWFKEGAVDQGGETRVKITVPEGKSDLRVMLSWLDPYNSAKLDRGMSPLINNLDVVVVTPDGREVKPLVLDAGTPDNPAVEGLDALNNIEQVVVQTPEAGAYEIVVRGTAVPQGPQDYYVTWYYAENLPKIEYPVGGEVLAPGETYLMKVRNMTPPLLAEVSYDGGKSFKRLGRAPQGIIRFSLPNDAPGTKQGVFRVSDAEGRVVMSPAPFVVMGVPQQLKVNYTPCDFSSMTLAWEAATGATKYEVLKASPEKGEYSVIGEVEATQPLEFKIPDGQITRVGRNIFTVRAVNAEGVKGERAVAQLVDATMPLKLTTATLPFEEAFKDMPLQYTRVEVGEEMGYAFIEAPKALQLEMGSHVLRAVPKAEKEFPAGAKAFDNATEPFTLRLGICSLDLREVTGKIFFNSFMQVAGDPERSQVRLLVGNDVVPLTTGESEVKASEHPAKFYWDLSKYAGQEVSIKLEYCACHSKNAEQTALLMVYYGIAAANEENDVSMLSYDSERTVLGSARESFEVAVINKGCNPVPRVDLLVKDASGRLRGNAIVTDLQPYERRVLNVQVDVSTAQPEGEVIPLTFEAVLEGEKRLQDNLDGVTIRNLGNLLPITHPSKLSFLGLTFYSDPKVSVDVKGELVFTDENGLLGDVAKMDFGLTPATSSVRFSPTTPNKVLKVIFEEIALEGEEGNRPNLAVYTEFFLEPFDFDAVQPSAVLSYRDNGTQPAFISTSKDGTLTISFTYNDEYKGAGWKARIVEVDPLSENTAKLVSLLAPTYDAESASFSVKARVKNVGTRPLAPGSLIASSPHLLSTHQVTTRTMAPGEEEEYEIAGIEAKDPIHTDLTVQFFAEDNDLSDNKRTVELAHDRYWLGGSLTLEGKGKLAFEDITVNASMRDQFNSVTRGVGYNMPVRSDEPLFTLYGESDNLLRVSLTTQNASWDDLLPASILLWFDGEEKDGEDLVEADRLLTIPLQKGKLQYEAIIPAEKLSQWKEGTRRMRLLVCRDDQRDAFIAGEKIALGEALDFMAKLVVAKSPELFNVKVGPIIAPISAKGLSNVEKVTVEVHNMGLLPLKRVKLNLSCNEEPQAEEMLQGLIPAGAKTTYTFEKTLDLSKVGSYALQVTAEVGGDVTPGNNSVTQRVFNVNKLSEKAVYSVALEGVPKEQIEITPFAKKVRDYTLEGWFYLDGEQTAILLEDEMGIAIPHGIKAFRNNSVVILGADAILQSEQGDIVSPNQWHHLAVSITAKAGTGFFSPAESTVKVYLDGKPIAMEEETVSEDWALSKPRFGTQLEGRMKMLRLWNGVREEAKIKDSCMLSAMKNDGLLPKACLFEYALNEGEGLGVGTSTSDEKVPFQAAELVKREREASAFWHEEQLLVNVEVEGQKFPAVWDAQTRTFQVKMPTGFSKFDAVECTFSRSWKNVALELLAEDGKSPLQEKCTLNFNNPEHRAKVIAKSTLFGIALEQEFTVQLLVDASAECFITQLEARTEDNPQLAAKWESGTDLAETLTLSGLKPAKGSLVEAVQDLKLKITLSEGATLSYLDGEYKSGDLLPIDLRMPRGVKVMAADKRTHRYYSLRVSEGQTLTWDSQPVTLPFSSAQHALEAKSTAGLPVKYRAENPNVVTVTPDGKLVTTGVGRTTVYALQEGNTLVSAAAPVTREYEVTRATLTVTPKPLELTEGIQAASGEVPGITYHMEGLVFGEPVNSFTPFDYAIYRGAEEVDLSKQSITPGDYTLKSKRSPLTYTEGNYSITLKEGTLKVVSDKSFADLIITLKEGTGLLEGVTVLLTDSAGREQSVITKSDGVASYRLPLGTYAVVYTKDGYQRVEAKVEVAEARVAVEQELQLAALTIIHKPEPNGQLKGVAVQKLARGVKTSAVYAIPDEGYLFAGWIKDGKLHTQDNPLVVEATEDATYQAHFLKGCRLTLALKDKSGSKMYSDQGTLMAMANGKPVYSGDLLLENTELTFTCSLAPRVQLTAWEGATVNPSDKLKATATITGDLEVTAKCERLTEVVFALYARIKGGTITPAGMPIVVDMGGTTQTVYTSQIGVAYLYAPPSTKCTYTVAKDSPEWNEKTGEFETDANPNIPKSVNISLTSKVLTRRLELFVKDGAGKPIKGALVSLSGYLGKPKDTYSDGKVAFNQLEEGTFTYTVTAKGYKVQTGEVQVKNPLHTLEIKLQSLTYDVPVRVVDTRGHAVPGAKVTIGTQEKETDADGVVFCELQTGEYDLKVTKEGYSDFTKTVVVNGLDEIVATLQGKAWHEVPFTVVDGSGNALYGAEVKVDGVVVPTDRQGKAAHKLVEGVVYSHEVSLYGYTTASGQTEAVTAQTEVKVTLNSTARATVTFRVKDALGRPLPDATVEIWEDGQLNSYTTLASGEVAVQLPTNQDYRYSISRTGCITHQSVLKQLAKDEVVEVTLEYREFIIDILPPEHGTISTSPADRANFNTVVTISVEPEAGYELIELNVIPADDSEPLDIEPGDEPNTFRFTMPAVDVMVTAFFERIWLNLEEPPAEEGTLTVHLGDATGKQLNTGSLLGLDDALYVEATPAKGYRLKELVVGQKSFSTPSATVMVRDAVSGFGAKVTVKATFEKEVKREKPTKPVTAVESLLLAGVKVLPNPFESWLRLEGVGGLRTLKLLTVEGRLVRTLQHDGAESLTLPTETLPTGVYLLHLVDREGNSRTLRVLKR